MKVINVNKFIDNARFSKFHAMMSIILLCIISFDGFDMVIYGATMPALMEYFGMNPTQAGFVASCTLIGAAIGALIFGLIANKIGRKKAIIIATLLFTLATAITGFSTNITMFAILRLITGLGLGGVMPNVVAISTEYSPLKNRAIIVAIIFSGMQIGGILASAMSMLLIPIYGWRIIYYIGAIPLILIPIIIKNIPDSAVHLYKKNKIKELKIVLNKIQKNTEISEDVVFEFSEKPGKAKISDLFSEHKAPSTILIWIVFFMNMYMIFGLGTWLPKLMIMDGAGLGSGILFLLTLNLGALISNNVAGIIADRIGYKKTLISLYLIAFCTILLLSFAENYALQIILVALAGAGFYGGQAIANGYVGLYYPTSVRSTAMGFAFGIGRIGAILGPSIAGFLVALGVPMSVNYMVLAVPGLIAALCIFLIQDKHGYLQKSKK